jgi:sensor histidine kinase YesM
MSTALTSRRWSPVFAGLRGVSWQTLVMILAINTGVAAILKIDDPRPFWQPLITAQCFGLAIAYCVNAARPWELDHPVRRLTGVVAIGTAIGFGLLILVKVVLLHVYAWDELRSRSDQFAMTAFSGFTTGLFVSLFFLVKFRENRAQAQMLRSEADRNLLLRQTAEAELKLMQAQVEPHFLFNTLASVQYLTESDPPRAGQMLGHLLAYLRTALPQLRSDSTTLGQEADLAQAYLSIMQMRMGARLAFRIAIPEELRALPFPPMLLMSVVENAVEHGIEPLAEGGNIELTARRDGQALLLTVIDTGRGLEGEIGQGVGLGNLRQRLRALHGERGRFTLASATPRGAVATIEIPCGSAAGH